MNQELNKLSNQVAKTLKLVDEKVIKSNIIDWNQIKRTPQIIRRKINLNDKSYTVDEEFDTLQDQFKTQEESLKRLINYLKHMNESMSDLLKDSISIGDSFSLLINPFCDFNHTHETFEEKHNKWNNMMKYKNLISKIDIGSEIDEFIHYNVNKLEGVLEMFKIIHQKLRERNNSLIDYDNLCNNYDSLLFKQQANELSLKQNNTLYSTKRKMEDYKHKYDIVNNTLKNELPQVCEYVKQILGYVQVDVYFLNLRYNYVTLKQLISFNKHNESTETIIKNFTDKNNHLYSKIEELGIINYEKKEISKLQTKEQELNFCFALYDYQTNNLEHLSFSKGNRIKILSKDGDWWEGELGNRRGKLPSNYVTLE
ncbi:hypothetical protein KGF54_005012 [Candida jiufengensis]|uniref:uncharacterized protein n=1 Tax=Candida jiufengensis TaxID=497108 RepID=UPI00222575C3|nr:uncharacterized protein KGF54_005012 [Candida jiufengensis]KAI5951937.1 hypothetical protein KGF54_005012 [Candida jiufengensis]